MSFLRKRRLLAEQLEERALLATITQLAHFDTWNGGTIPSTDAAGIAFHAPSGNLYLADSEINETPEYLGKNIFELSPDGQTLVKGIDSNNDEPTGITYNEFDGYFYVTNDDEHTVQRYDNNLNSPLATAFTVIDVPGAKDAEGITSDPSTGYLYVVDGSAGGRQVLVYDPDLNFEYSFPVSAQLQDAEGIAFNPDNNHLFVVSSPDDLVAEYALNGVFIDSYDISTALTPAPIGPQGATFGPTSDPFDDPSALALYIADGGGDQVLDGGIYETLVSGAELPHNTAPLVNAGGAQEFLFVDFPLNINLNAGVADDGAPGPPGTLTTSWSQVSGPDTATFLDSTVVDPTVTFPGPGTYVLRLTANDGGLITSDDTTIIIKRGIEVQITASTDDAEETTISHNMDLISGDLDIGGTIVGLRFPGLNIPQDATIVNAYVQFGADENSVSASSLTIAGENTDSATTFTNANGNITSRTPTSSTVAWSPAEWTRRDAGLDQRTPNVSSIVQEIVSRPGWSSGNALALMISGSGNRPAESTDGNYSKLAPILHIEFNTTPGVTITESDGSSDVTEGGATDSYLVALDTIPTANVDITITPDSETDLGAGAGVPIVLNFTPGNAIIPQVVNVTAVDDTVHDGLHTSTVTHTAVSADANYNAIAIDDVAINIKDNDTPGVTVTESSGSTYVTEGSLTDSYSVVLDSEPTDNVTITITPDGQTNLGAGAGTAIVLTFTPGNAFTPQVVNVTAFDDVVNEGTHSSTITHAAASTDLDFNAIPINSVTANITDNDTASVIIIESDLSTDVTEGGATDTYDVLLGSQPQTGTTVTIAIASADGQTSTTLTSLVFDETNWNTPQMVTVTAVDDIEVEGSPHLATITHTATSADTAFDGIAIDSVTVSITENDTFEGTTLYLSLNSGMTLPGNIDVDNEDVIAFDGTDFRLYFDGSDVGVAATKLDALAVISANEILLSFSSPEIIPGIAGTVEDSDIVKFTATQLGVSTAGTFELFFRGSDVGLSPSTEDIDAIDLHNDGRVIISTVGDVDVPGVTGRDEDLLAFTPNTPGDYSAGTWAMYVDGSDIEIAGEDIDAIALNATGDIHLSTTNAFAVTGLSGDETDAFTFSPTQLGDVTTGTYSSTLQFDGSLFGLSGNDVSGMDRPDSSAGVTITESSGSTNVTEGGATDSYEVVLESKPESGTTVTIAIVTTGQTTTTPTSLVFDDTNWNVAQSVTVSAVDDARAEGSHSDTITHTATSTDTQYNGININNVNTNITDNDIFAGTTLFLSLNSGMTLPGNVNVENEDVIAFDGTDFSLFFDGSDVGLAAAKLDALAVISANELLLSFTNPEIIPGIAGTVEASDIVKFTATQLGVTTSGAFELFFRGSDAGLDVGLASEDIDAVDLHNDGRLIISTVGNVDVPGVTARDEDLIAFTPDVPGDYSTGTWAFYFDGSDVEIAGEDIDAVALKATGEIHLSTTNAFSVTGVSGDEIDAFTFLPTQLGADTTGSYASAFLFDGSLFGLTGNDVSGMDIPGAGVTIAEIGDSTDVSEGGITDTYDVILNSPPQPGTIVTIMIATPDGQTTASPTSLTFDETNWNVAQTVTVTALNDVAVEASPHIGIITHTTTSTDPNYNGIGVNSVIARITDNDTAGVTISESGGSTDLSEGGAADFYDVVLDSQPQPGTSVTITIATADGQTTTAPTSLVFDDTNWDVAQTVTVNAVDDALAEGPHTGSITHTASSTDTNYNGIAIANVTANVSDNDAGAIITESGGSTDVSEGGPSDSYGVVLISQPQPGTTVTITIVTADGQTTTTPTSLVFDENDWNVPQTVTVVAAEDAVDEGSPHAGTITHIVSSADTSYDGISIAAVTANISDNDAAGVTIIESGGSTDVTEGGPFETYDVVLDSQPQPGTSVTIAIVSGDGQTTTVPTSLVFTESDWNIAQTVTVNAADDAMAEGSPHIGTITHTASSTDANYNGINVASVTANIIDNDAKGVTITQTGGSTDVIEGGTGDTYDLVLTSQPQTGTSVTITIGTTDGQTTTIPTSLVFDATNWNVAQIVTVNAVDDTHDEAALHGGVITHTATSADANYNGISIDNVVASITDNDTGGVTIVQSGGTTDVSEDGGPDSYTIALESIPTASVQVTVTPDGQTDLGAGAGTAIVLTFTPANALTPQPINVTALNDAIAEGLHTGTITHAAVSTDTDYNGIAMNDVVVNITDNDTAGVTINEAVWGAAATSSIDIRVMGDVPYKGTEYAELEADLAIVGPNDQFFVHLGDIQSEGVCVESTYSSVASSLQTSSIPVFIIPGDNEWNDCADPNQAWTYWDTHLMRLEENWSHSLTVLRQPVREENFAIVESGVLFIGINLVGDTVHDQSEWTQRMADDANWVNENFANFGSQVTSAVIFGHSFADPNKGDRQQFGLDFVTAAQNFGKPILYMQGDDHHWVLDNPYAAAPNVTRVVVEQGVPSVRTTITNDPIDPFTFESTDVTEGGRTDGYTIVLDSEPTANVDVTVTPDNQTDLGSGPGTPIVLTFTPANALTPQLINITAVDDAVVEGQHTSTITHTVTSTDTNFNGLSINDVVANITDNDTPGVTIAESDAMSDVIEGGAADSYTVVLDSVPTVNVDVTVTPDSQTDLGAGAGTAIVLSFTPANALTPQTVNVTAVDDAIVEGLHTSTITHTAVSTDANYNGIGITSLTANITDNDAAGVTITESGTTDVSEGGATDSYDVVLDSQPQAGKTVAITIGTADGQTTTTLTSLVFDDSNWNVAQSVTVTAVDDAVAEGLHTGSITHTAISTDANYNGIAIASLTANVTDNDTAGVSIIESGTTDVVEGGATDSYDMVLNSQPQAGTTVTIAIATSDGQATTTLTSLVFDETNWNVAQSVTVTAVDDAVAEGLHTGSITHTATSTDANYNGIGIASLTANITDNDTAGVTITESGTTDVVEGGATDSYDVVLNSQPQAGTTVTIAIATSDGQTTTIPNSLVFDETNWNVAQSVTVTAVDDAVAEGLHTGSITHTATSTDANYDGVGIASLTANITDNDTAGVTITESGTTDVVEGGATDSYDVVLNSQPQAGTTVTIAIATSDGQTTTAPTSLVFDETNWNVAQSVTVTAVDDAVAEGLHTGSISHTAVSTDANYNGIGIASVTANITDNDAAGVTITESGTTDVVEGGATDSYDVVLNSQPETGSTVTITIGTADGQTTTSTTSLVFDDSNWNIAQSVTVTAVDDAVAEGLHTGSITHTATSTDANYDSVGIASLTASITDNDTAGVTITESGGTTDVSEGGPSDSYDVVLDSQPQSGTTVTIAIATSDGQTSTAPTSLVFDDSNWNVAQSVTVTAVDDAVAEALHTGSILHTATSTDANYNGIGIASLTANITDNDVAGVTITESGATDLGEGGATDSYDVVLDSQPEAGSTVTIAIATSDGQTTTTPASLVFDDSNWNVAQSVTVTAVDDAVAEGLHAGSITHTATSTDAAYNGIAIASLTANITDNDVAGVTIIESGTTDVVEGGATDSYDVVLNSQPQAGTTVTIAIATSDGQTTTTATSLVFDETNWNVAQTVTVTAVDDPVIEGLHAGSILHTAISTDANYNGIGIASLTANITDNDTAGVTITETGGTTDVGEGGATDSYDVVLNSQPQSGTTVTITIDTSDVQTNTAPSSLVFDETNWNVAQSVTVTAVDDAVAEGLHTGSITHTATSTDANYNGIGITSLTANVTDNDAAGVTITETGGTTDVGEGGLTDSYDVVLNSQPEAGTTVTITINTANSQTTTTPTALVFDETNWSVAKSVTVTAVDDAVAEGLHTGSIMHTATSTDANYNGIGITSLIANIADNDSAGVTITESSTTEVGEGGATDSYDVALTSQPANGASVTIAIGTADSQTTTSTTSLVFDYTNWNIAQSVTVTAVDDAVAEGLHIGSITHAATSTDTNYDGISIASLTANITDNDSAGVTITESGGTTDVSEGGPTDSYEVALNSQPQAGTTVTITIGASDSQNTTTPTSLVFDDTNWNVAQSVTVTAVDDPVIEGLHTGSMSHTAVSTDTNYNGISIASVTANITDNDVAGVTIIESGTTDVSEGGPTDSYDVVLNSQPQTGTSVTITIATADGQTATTPTSLVFDDSNWNVAQTVTVTAVDDPVIEGLHTGSITHTVTSTDSNYDGISIASLTANIADNDFAGVTISESGTTDVSEGGATDSYDVVLNSQPQAGTSVTIAISASDGQTTTTPTSLVFDDSNWNVVQTVTVTAVDDAMAEGTPHTGSITHTVVSTDTNYNGISVASVTANITDNDAPGVTITESSGTTGVSEGGATDSYDVVLNSQPQTGTTVTIAIATSDGQTTTTPTSLVFDETNWNVAQSVTVTAVDDAVDEGASYTGIITHTATSTDANYNGIGIASLTANITDNDAAGVTITESSGTTDVSEGGLTDSYDVVLDSQPEAGKTVTITINTADNQTTTTPASLVFNETNWNVSQTVTLTAVDDAVDEGATYTGSITHTATSTDANYNGIGIASLTANITDNDFAGVTITESDSTTDVGEGGATDSYDVVLNSQPANGASVTIAIGTADSQTTTSTTSLVFDYTNWNIAQSVTVTAVDDAVAEGLHIGSITHTATSTDANYNGIGIASLTANITDNDLAGVTITESDGTTDVSEGGATDNYDVVLNSQPETGTTVTIAVATSDGQTTTTPASLVFNETNWNVAQSVTVTAVDDAVDEGATYTGSITHTATSTDANYNGISIASVTANIADNDLAGVTITESDSTTDVGEGEATDNYDVVLNSQPETGTTVTIAVATGDGQTITTPTSLVFDDTNWNVAQSVTVTAVDDAVDEGLHTSSITHTATSADANYNGIGIASLTANITDNDFAGVTITESDSTTDVGEGGATDSYDVVLNSQPQAGTTVTIAIATSDGQTTVTPTSLVFDDTNWNVAQSVTVTAVDDAVAEGLHNGSITHTATSADANYNGIGIVSLSANITDNDFAGVTITESGGTTDVSEGGATDSYDVVLNSQPQAGTSVTIAIATSDGQTTVTPTSLVFDDTNWNVAQTVTVTAVEDAVAEGPHAGSITHTATSTDASYNGISVASLTANITDNDFAGVTITESGDTTYVSEGGPTDSYDVVLDSQPQAGTTVTITIAVSDGQTTVTPTSLVFDATNWNVAQSVTVTAVDDAFQEGSPHTGSITHTATSTDANYNSIGVASLTANITDNDFAGVTITESGGTTDVSEGGATDSYDVVLNSQPQVGTTVTITIATVDSQTSTNPTSLQFDATNWNVAQSVTVTAVDDALQEASPHTGSVSHTVTSTDTNYNGIGIASVTANITDNDTPGVTITESGTTDVSEGGATDSYNVVLESQPETGKTVTITVNTADGQTTTTPTSLVFDETNWNIAQNVIVTAVDDAVAEGLHAGSITHTVTSTDANYNGIGIASLTANITDNDAAGVTITESGTTDVGEGGATDSYDVVLDSQPQAGTTVTITVNTADGQTTTTPTSLVFDETNWNIAQNVIVTAVDDAVAEGLHAGSITHTVTSTDSNYDGIAIASLTANITDNDAAGVTITESGTTDVSEGGATDSYDVVLDSQPQAGTTVTITINTADSQTITTPTSLVFDDANWNVAQSVTVTAVDDAVDEGLHAGSITHTVTSTDANYNGIGIASLTANITDNDAAGVTITESGGTTDVGEAGATDSYDVVLDSQPQAGTTVTITVNTADSQTTTTPTSLVFDETNWNVAQSVTVTAVDDAVAEGLHAGSITHTVTSTDANYNGIGIASLTANITDNDAAGVTITESGTTDVGEGGATDSYDVVLDSQPQAGTTVTITVNTADSQTTTTPTSLVFDETNWNVAQSVTVTAVDDAVDEGLHTSSITHTATSTDANYNGFGIASLTANITDNDFAGVTITESDGTTDVSEGGATDSYDVVLNSQPQTGTTVTITINTADSQTITAPASLVFDETNWNVAQSVTVTAVDDAVDEGLHTSSITHTATSTDANYNGFGIASLTANITDNDFAGVTITESDGTTDVSEGGATDSYDVVLNSQPQTGTTVTIAVATGDGQTITTPTSLVFDDTNWNVAQSVIVTAVDDAVAEGLHAGSITHTVTSTDSNYDGIGVAGLTANITDNDAAGVTITESGGTTDVSEGGATDSYDVVLDSQPQAGTTVTITINTADSQTTTAPASLVFDDTNWNVAQSVTVTAVDDAVAEGLHAGSITHTVTSTDSNYDGIGVAGLTANITDNDAAGVTITESGGTTDVGEGGVTDSYDVVLDSQPQAGTTVTITINTADSQTITAPASLVFDETNWNVAQSVTVTAVDDAVDEGLHAGSITHTVTSTDSNYDGIGVAGLTANITDNDAAGVTITESGGTTDVSEGGATDSYDVVLDSQPQAGTTVTITINTADSQTTTAPASLVFDDTNWNVAQSVTVTAVDDAVDEGLHAGSITHTVTSTDSNYDGIGIAGLTANITDNDAAGVTITESGGTTDVGEAGVTDSYDVVLNSQPQAGTTVTITINTADSQTITAPASLVFDETNWNVAQSVIVTAVDDAVAEGLHAGSITHTVTSTDSNYDGIGVAGLTANITDNDAAGVTITESGGTTDVGEAGVTDSYDVVLDSQPQAGTTVTITINTADSQTITAPTSLVFDETNWNVAQSVTVTAVDDAVAEGLHAGSITHTVTSTDSNYDGIGIASLTANITDNDAAGVTITESGGTTDVGEAGVTDSYDVVLDSQPQAGTTVTITINTADSQTITAPTSLVFDETNWNVAQSVTVTAVDDAVAEGLHAGSITHTVTSTDSNYDGIGIASLTANITDNDAAGVTITESGGTTDVGEAGVTDSYDVVLDSQPQAGTTVTITINTADSQTTATPTSLVFDETNWNVAQSVTVTAVDDAVAEGLHAGSITHTVTSTDSNYNGIGIASLTANITDNDAAGVTITESGTTDVSEGGATDSYDVVLDSQPRAGTTVTITVNTADGQTTTAPTSLVFDDANWNVAQSVTVTAVDDAVVEGLHAGSITHAATSTDTYYSGTTVNNVVANITDNDVAEASVLYISFKNSAVLPGGLTVDNEDIVAFDGTNFSLFFDGSDVGLLSTNVDAIAVIGANELLLSFRAPETIPGIAGVVQDSDIVKFTATQFGDTTSGSFELFFRGSDFGFSPIEEDIDAIDLHPDGRLVVSTIGNYDASGLTGGDEDLLAFTPNTPGDYSAGTWEIYFDGSDVELGREDVYGVALDPNGNIHLSLTSAFAVTGLSGNDQDVLTFNPSQLGANTAGTYDPTLLFDGSQFGLDAIDVNGVDIPATGGGSGDALLLISRAAEAIELFAKDDAETLDVNADSAVTALDAILVINSLSVLNADSLDDGRIDEMDVNQDGTLSALDALVVVNHLSRASVPQGESIAPAVRSIDEPTIQQKQDAVQSLQTTSSQKINRLGSPQPTTQHDPDALRSRAIIELMDETQVDVDLDDTLAADIMINMIEFDDLF